MVPDAHAYDEHITGSHVERAAWETCDKSSGTSNFSLAGIEPEMVGTVERPLLDIARVALAQDQKPVWDQC